MLSETLVARLKEAAAQQAERKKEQQEKLKIIIENFKMKAKNNFQE